MYDTIMVALENSAADRTMMEHIRPLARLAGSRFLLVHVADGWVARKFLGLDMAESEEMRDDKIYLEKQAEELRAEGFEVETLLAAGDPATQIVKVSQNRKIDLIAMTTHGHRFISDLLYGSTADKVRHEVSIPVLLLKVK